MKLIFRKTETHRQSRCLDLDAASFEKLKCLVYEFGKIFSTTSTSTFWGLVQKRSLRKTFFIANECQSDLNHWICLKCAELQIHSWKFFLRFKEGTDTSLYQICFMFCLVYREPICLDFVCFCICILLMIYVLSLLYCSNIKWNSISIYLLFQEAKQSIKIN